MIQHPPGTICIISGELTRYWQFTASLFRMRAPTGSARAWARSCNIAENLNECIRAMRGEWAWFIGDDHDWPADIIPRLLDHNVDVVSPVVLKRKSPFTPVVYRRESRPGFFERIDLDELPTSGLIEVEAASVAGMLVRKSVLAAVGDPWFRAGQIDPQKTGEDLDFCKRVRAAGFAIHVDCDMTMDHLTPVAIRPRVINGRWMVEIDLDGVVTQLDMGKAIRKGKERRRAEQEDQPGVRPVPV